jgi:2-hydroxy-3-oxopropionate reductase
MDHVDTKMRIAVLGIGLMGAPMVRRLVAAGFPVVAWNRTRAKAEALRPVGVEVAETPGAAVSDCDVVITMLENGQVVEHVLFGPDGAAAAARPATLFIDMSSIPPAMARDQARRLIELGMQTLDAPVSGGTVGAEQGTLAIMAGGSAEAFARATPVFEAMGRPTHVGPSGAGQLAKLANQTIVAVTIGAVSEALLLAAAGGADPAAVRRAIRGGFAESRILELHGQRMIDRDFAPRGLAHIQLKDLDTIMDEAGAIGLTLPLASNVRDRFRRLCTELDGSHLDHSALLVELEALNSPHKVTG